MKALFAICMMVTAMFVWADGNPHRSLVKVTYTGDVRVAKASGAKVLALGNAGDQLVLRGHPQCG